MWENERNKTRQEVLTKEHHKKRRKKKKVMFIAIKQVFNQEFKNRREPHQSGNSGKNGVK